MKQRFLVTCRHGRAPLSFIECPPEIETVEQAAEFMRSIVVRDQVLVYDEGVIDMGKPLYQAWKLVATSSKEDLAML